MTVKILVVEDDIDLQKIVTQGLTTHGYECVVADNGQKGLDMARKEKPDAIILDILMPVMDGFECCAALREDEAFDSTPIIFLTAKADDWDLLTGYVKGCDVYLKKPFSLETLLDELKGVLSH